MGFWSIRAHAGSYLYSKSQYSLQAFQGENFLLEQCLLYCCLNKNYISIRKKGLKTQNWKSNKFALWFLDCSSTWRHSSLIPDLRTSREETTQLFQYVTWLDTQNQRWPGVSRQVSYPKDRAHYNNSALKISGVRKSDSDWHFCSAVNLLGNAEGKTLLVVGSPPVFTVKPPGKVSAATGDTLTLNCSATGDPQPVISWKRQGATLPVGRVQGNEGALILRDLRREDAGNYICVATSAGVFDIETISEVRVGPIASGTGKWWMVKILLP